MQKQHSSSTGVMWQIADEGWPVLALAGFITILLTIIYTPLGTFALGLIVWLAHILRVPHRQSPDDDDAILAPADGRVIDVADSHYPDAAADRPAIRISIRTALSDAQLQRAPIEGQIIDNFSLPGMFHPFDDMELVRLDNERREIIMQHESGYDVTLVQLGGKTARQLVCRHQPGRFVVRGAPLGMIRIAGVADLFVPADANIQTNKGQHVLAGETIIARCDAAAHRKSSDKVTGEGEARGNGRGKGKGKGRGTPDA